jgi:recombination protein RecA
MEWEVYMSTADFAARMNKKLGSQVVVPASELIIPRRYTSGSFAFDAALGGGYPANQFVEVIGPSSAGKTFTTFKCIAANQRQDPAFSTLWVAGEHFDKDQAEALGVDLSRVMLVRTQVMEHAMETMIDGIECQEFDCVTLDSYPALVPSDEAEKGMDEHVMASGAKILNKFIRKVGPGMARALDGSDRPFFGIFINQWREKIGVMYGDPRTTPGGKGKDYFFYVRVELSRDGDFIKEKRPGQGEVKVGQSVKLKTIKNKSASPQKIATVDLYFSDAPSLGFVRGDYDVAKEYIDIGISLGFITRAGAYYRYGGQQWQGKDGLTAALRSDSLLQEALRRDVLSSSQELEQLDYMEG